MSVRMLKCLNKAINTFDHIYLFTAEVLYLFRLKKFFSSLLEKVGSRILKHAKHWLLKQISINCFCPFLNDKYFSDIGKRF